MLNKMVIAAMLAITAPAVLAADAPHFYGGADLTRTKFDGLSDREPGYGLFVGYQVNQTFAIETAYRNLADASEVFEGDEYEAKLSQGALSATATIPLGDSVKLYGRLGYNRVTYRMRTSFGLDYKEHENKALYGVGLKYDVTPTVSVRFEVQKPASDLTTLSAGMAFHF
jgi:OmpA-OmpF porin, OOP family